jgi:phenylalanyl-tRNA synthetase beta subunit
VTAERVLGEIRAGGGDLPADVTLFDPYRGESIPTGTKSLAFAPTFQGTATLSEKDVDKAHAPRRLRDEDARRAGAGEVTELLSDERPFQSGS